MEDENNNTLDENNNNTINTTNTIETRVESIENNVSAIMQADLFLVAFIVVLVVCYILYKAVDKFISF